KTCLVEASAGSEGKNGILHLVVRRYGAPPWSRASFERYIRFRQPIRDCAVGTHHVGYAIGQDQFRPVDGCHSEQHIALIDEVEHGSDDERDIERPAGHAVGYRVPVCDLPGRIRTHSITLTFMSMTLRPGLGAQPAISPFGRARPAIAPAVARNDCTIRPASRMPRPHRRPTRSTIGTRWRRQGPRADRRRVDKPWGAACRRRPPRPQERHRAAALAPPPCPPHRALW